jgi:hypothetical protein
MCKVVIDGCTRTHPSFEFVTFSPMKQQIVTQNIHHHDVFPTMDDYLKDYQPVPAIIGKPTYKALHAM